MSRRLQSLLLACAAILLLGAKDRAVRLPVPAAPPTDIYSFSEPSKIVVRHLDLDLSIDLDARRIDGTATLQLQNFSGTDTLVLDTRDLEIHGVTRDGHTPAAFNVGEATTYGAPLVITIEPTTKSVTIDYTARKTANVAVLWTRLGVVNGRPVPLAVSANEPIGARCWIPLQDTPAVRATWDATLHVPDGMLALMSAEGNPTSVTGTSYSFHMPHSVPSYLIAFAVGRIGFRPLSERSAVYAQPELLETAASLFHNIPGLITSSEAQFGPYQWGRYDVLVVTNEYPGAMENPLLTFISNRESQAATADQLIAHELSHSWAGNMVTLATWGDTWLNEGLASYFEYRLLEPLKGKAAVDAAWASRQKSFASYVKGVPSRATLLHVPMTLSDDPNAVFSPAAYTKGSLFFRTLESVMGREAFDRLIEAYFAHFAWHFVDDKRFIDFLRATGLTPELESRLGLEEWIYEPGLPASSTTWLSSSAIASDGCSEIIEWIPGRTMSAMPLEPAAARH